MLSETPTGPQPLAATNIDSLICLCFFIIDFSTKTRHWRHMALVLCRMAVFLRRMTVFWRRMAVCSRRMAFFLRRMAYLKRKWFALRDHLSHCDLVIRSCLKGAHGVPLKWSVIGSVCVCLQSCTVLFLNKLITCISFRYATYVVCFIRFSCGML